MTDQTTPNTDRRKDSLPNYKWLQLPVDYLDDPDFNQLSDAAGFLFIRLYLVALKADAEGIVGNGRKTYTSKDLAFTFRKSEPDTSKQLQELEAAGFIETKPNIRVCRFLDEQGPGSEEQRKQWRERQRKHRARLNGEGESGEIENDQKNGEANLNQENINQADLNKAENRGEELNLKVTGESRNVTVTSPGVAPPVTPPPPTPDFVSEFNTTTGMKASPKDYTAIETIFKATTDIQKTRARLKQCGDYWRELAPVNGWAVDNSAAVLELYPSGALEERKKRERVKTARNGGKAAVQAILEEESRAEKQRRGYTQISRPNIPGEDRGTWAIFDLYRDGFDGEISYDNEGWPIRDDGTRLEVVKKEHAFF